ncbi:MAG: sigma 54-interacting transcriptional regulator [Acidobacteria bacterium]|nr:sigma 54-interacting transcriptional regulator [Acidobacteriota bacterium]MCA1627648.1 sigma 54-interacting transcriptional regulator [Acidobacteriota bacterium]
MNTTPGQVAVADEQRKKYLTLLELSKAIASHRDLTGLFHDLACRLQSLVDFSHLGVLLYDKKHNVMRFHLLETCEPTEAQAPLEVPMEGSIAGWVWQNQDAVVIRDLENDDRFPYAKILLTRPVKSIVSVPLTTAHQRLGVVNFWSDKMGAYDDLDIEFVKLVGAQIAVAVEAQCYQRRLAHERDRSQLLLEINNTLISNLNLRELLAAISNCLRRVIPHDVAGLALYDAQINKLRVNALEGPGDENLFIADEIIDLESTPSGRAFTTRQPVINTSPDQPPSSLVQRAGLKSGVVVPLISHDRALGTLGVGSQTENAFTEDDAELLNQVGKQVAIAVENALAFRQIDELKNQLTEEKLYLEEEIRTEYNFEEIIGNSSTLRRVLQDVETVAATASTVLIYGETGTGKELIAHAIHNLSPRRERTLVKVNCAAIPTGLLESEFFGHERGAFTGAIDRRIGRFELAHQGTIFLDEVEDIPLELQSKLLRVLQEHEFERLGSSRTQRVDVRIIAATNTELTELVAERKFRSDLYYRLNVFPINVPPLRDRPEDIPLLVHFFAHRFAQQMKKKIESVPKDTMAALVSYNWPGNIRELQNLVERGVILSRGSTLEIPLTELKRATRVTTQVNDSTTLEAVERDHILRVLSETRWVIGGPSGAAARLGMNRTTLNHRMRKLGISRPQPQHS